MKFDFTLFYKAIIGGIGTGMCATGALSLLIPSLVVTDHFLMAMATAGGVILPAIYLRYCLGD